MSVPVFQLTGGAVQGIVVDERHRLAVSHLPTQVCLGRNPPPVPRRPAVVLSEYLRPGAVPPPPTLDYYTKAAASVARMYLNDRYGCCVVSGKGHLFGLWSANDSDSGGVILGTDTEIYNQYQSWCGPGDNGCNIQDVLDAIKRNGMTLGGKKYKFDWAVDVDWTNKVMTQAGLTLFCGGTIGFDLPGEWMNSAVWDVTNSAIVGGHDVTPCGYDAQGVFVMSWGRLYKMTWAAWQSRRYIGEFYVMLGPPLYNSDQKGPLGLNLETLTKDIQAIQAGQIPDVGPVSPPPPPPGPPPPPPPPPPTGVLVGPSVRKRVDIYDKVGVITNSFWIEKDALDLRPVVGGTASVAWLALFRDVRKLVADVQTIPFPQFQAAFQKLWADVKAFNFTAVLADLQALLALANQLGLPVIVADLKAIAADLGFVIPFAPSS